MLVGRCHHNGWPHSCERCRWEIEHLDDIEAHDKRYWYGTAWMFLERLLDRESECRALRRRNAELEERERVRRSFKGRLWQSLRRALFGTDVPKKDERS